MKDDVDCKLTPLEVKCEGSGRWIGSNWEQAGVERMISTCPECRQTVSKREDGRLVFHKRLALI